jgi:hypothetical protein
MIWFTLERVWLSSGRKSHVKVRFHDWTHQIKYFTILGESEDGKRFIGTLDNGEKISYSKKSKGWRLYEPNDEYHEAHAV